MHGVLLEESHEGKELTIAFAKSKAERATEMEEKQREWREKQAEGREKHHAADPNSKKQLRKTQSGSYQSGRGGIENKHSTDIESPPPPCSDLRSSACSQCPSCLLAGLTGGLLRTSTPRYLNFPLLLRKLRASV